MPTAAVPVPSSAADPRDLAAVTPAGASAVTSAATRASSEIIVRKMDSGEAARKTAESRQRLEDLFSRLDLNKDGVIDPKELQAGLRVMGYRHVTQEQIDVRHNQI